VKLQPTIAAILLTKSLAIHHLTMSRLALRRGLVLSQPSTFLGAPIRSASAPAGTRAIAGGAISTPKVAQPSFWISLVPKFMRRSSVKTPTKPRKDWNPATYFIVMFLMVGSMSIQMISLKKDFATFTRRTDVRITLLRETVEKLQRGEKVDVERVLGTGDAEHEQQWEDGMWFDF